LVLMEKGEGSVPFQRGEKKNRPKREIGRTRWRKMKNNSSSKTQLEITRNMDRGLKWILVEGKGKSAYAMDYRI